jgi:uncharacterized membrane protein SpoIIM required for sporulation
VSGGTSTPGSAQDASIVRSFRFRREREATWRALEDLVLRAERGGLGALNESDLRRLPVLYRATLSSLSVARAISLDAALLEYLEGLAGRAYFVVYGTRANFTRGIAGFFARRFPDAIRALVPEILVAAALMLGAAVISYLMVIGNLDWYYAFIDEAMAQGRTPATSPERLSEMIYDPPGAREADALDVFAAHLFTHNTEVSLLAFALGFALGLPTAWLLVHNGLSIGAFVALFEAKGLGPDILGWLAVHGTTELFGIIVAGAAGLRIGRAVADPGRLSRLDALKAAGGTAGLAMLGVAVMLFLAAILEAFARQLVTDIEIRFLIGGVMLTFWIVYFAFVGRDRTGGRDGL